MRPRDPGPDPWRFLDDDEHPFGVRVLDMRTLAVGARSSPHDAQTRERFTASRGKPPEPTQDAQFARRHTLSLVYPRPPGPLGPWLFQARAFEDKWDISTTDDHLVARRSWTGVPALRARMRLGSKLVLDRIEAAPDWDDDLAPRHLDFLVWTMLFGRPVPHPVPLGALDDPAAATRWSYGLHGRHAWFACEADLTEALRARAPRP